MWFDNPILHGAVIFAICFFVSRWWYKTDEKVEDRRREAIKMAGALKEGGQTWIADFVTDYAVGDYDEMAVKMAKLINLSKHDPAMKAKLKEMALEAVTGQLRDPATREAFNKDLEAMGAKVGDTVEGKAMPFLDPRVEAFIKAAMDAKSAAVAGAKVAVQAAAPEAAALSEAAKLALQGISASA